MHDEPATADDLVLRLEPMALRMGEQYPGRGVVERDEMVGEAWLALHDLAARYADRTPEPAAIPVEEWFRRRIRERLRTFVRKAIYWFLADVPVRLHRKAVRVRSATEHLRARGILRPTYEHIAEEAGVAVDVVIEVAGFARVVQRQSAVEWAEDYRGARREDEPAVVPCFGPRPGFEPSRPCNEIVRHPIPQGSALCCGRCWQSGQDHHWAVRRDPRADPAPEPAPAARKPEPGPASRETRRAKRQRLFAPQAVA